ETEGRPRQRQRHSAAARWQPISWLALLWLRTAGPLGGDCRRQRQRVDLEFRDAEQSYNRVVRREDRELPSRLQDRTTDFAARWLCRWGIADADRSCRL